MIVLLFTYAVMVLLALIYLGLAGVSLYAFVRGIRIRRSGGQSTTWFRVGMAGVGALVFFLVAPMVAMRIGTRESFLVGDQTYGPYEPLVADPATALLLAGIAGLVSAATAVFFIRLAVGPAIRGSQSSE